MGKPTRHDRNRRVRRCVGLLLVLQGIFPIGIGVQISVVGTIGPRTAGVVSPQSNYTVDGSTPNVYTATQDSTVHYSTRFYLSPTLPDGQHTLIVTNILDSDSFFIDYFLVYKSSTDTSWSPKVVTVTSTTTPSSTSQSSASSGRSTANTGTIVGSALGAAALVIVAVAIILWLRGRNKRDFDEPQVIRKLLFRHFLMIPQMLSSEEFVPPMVHARPPSDTLRTSSQPVHAFASTISDVATGPQTQSGNRDALAPPPRYTLDLSQPLIPVRGTSESSGNLRASKFRTPSPTNPETIHNSG